MVHSSVFELINNCWTQLFQNLKELAVFEKNNKWASGFLASYLIFFEKVENRGYIQDQVFDFLKKVENCGFIPGAGLDFLSTVAMNP